MNFPCPAVNIVLTATESEAMLQRGSMPLSCSSAPETSFKLNFHARTWRDRASPYTATASATPPCLYNGRYKRGVNAEQGP